jgi:hypothetical protein
MDKRVLKAGYDIEFAPVVFFAYEIKRTPNSCFLDSEMM